MLEKMKLLSRCVAEEVTLNVKRMVNPYGEEFIAVDNRSLERAFKKAEERYHAKVSEPVSVSNDIRHPAFQCRIEDENGYSIPVIGEACSRNCGNDNWQTYLITLAQMRCVYRAIIKYMDFNYPGKVFSIHENVVGMPYDKWLAEQEAAQMATQVVPIPHTEEAVIPSAEEIKSLGIKETADVSSTPSGVSEDETASEAVMTVAEETVFTVGDDQPFMATPTPAETKPEATPAEPTPTIKTVQSEKELMDALGNTLVKGGKYAGKGMTLKQVYESDIEWLQTMVDTPTTVPARQKFQKKAKAYLDYMAEQGKPIPPTPDEPEDIPDMDDPFAGYAEEADSMMETIIDDEIEE